MESATRQFALAIATGVELAAAVLIAYGALEAIFLVARDVKPGHSVVGIRRQAWLRFAVWLLLGLEFELAADIVRTAISPTWSDIGQLAAIGAIRTALNYFLEKDLERYEPKEAAAALAPSPDLAAR